jgi:hypothetical protein
MYHGNQTNKRARTFLDSPPDREHLITPASLSLLFLKGDGQWRMICQKHK